MSNCARSFNDFESRPDWFDDSAAVFVHVGGLPADNPTVRRAVRQACLRKDASCGSCRQKLEETFQLACEMVEFSSPSSQTVHDSLSSLIPL